MIKQSIGRINIKHIIVLFLALAFGFSTSVFFLESNPVINAQGIQEEQILEFDGSYDWETTLDVQTSSTDYITYSDFRDNYCKWDDTAYSPSACASAASGKEIRFDTAEELYRFSMDVSLDKIYNTGNAAEDKKLSDTKIAVLLSLHYVLGNDLDYSIMQSKAFIPIGYAFTDVDENVYQRSFTGVFDGRGFEIQNLYVAGYDSLVYVDYVDEVTTIDIAISEHYSMFNYNEGTIKNLGLVDSEMEILELHTDITKLSNLVGFNMSSGVVDNVYVIDTRTNLVAGMRYNVGTASEDFEAAGIIHTNQGTFTDAYYASRIVINANYVNKFDVQPVLYTNSGTIDNLVFDSELYLEQVTVGGSTFYIDIPNALATGESTNMIKSTSSSLNEGDIWYFYPEDGYPLLKGFDYYIENDEVYFEIDNAVDFVFFAQVIGFDTLPNISNAVDYSASNFVLTDNIDFSTVAPDAYKIPSATFTGLLSGYNDSGTDLSDNYYIYNLNIEENIVRGNDYYAGMFSILGAGSEISNLNFSQSSVSFTDTDDNYSFDFYMGAIAGKMIGGTISNILLDVDMDMGTEALGTTYAGNVVGKASGVIEYVASYGAFTSGTHVYASASSMEPIYYIGGIVGAAKDLKLRIADSVNHGDISGLGTTSDVTLATGYTAVNIYIGGVIGYLKNATGSINELVNVSNFGDIDLQSFRSSSTPAYIYAGGVFGKLEGIAPILEASNEYKFANLYNEGDINHTYVSNTATIRAAGIGVNNASTAIEYALLFNHGTFNLVENSATYTQTQFKYSTILYDIGNSAVTLSRTYNYGDLNLDSNVYTLVSGMFVSDNNVTTYMRYVANYGDINFMKDAGVTEISMTTDLDINGVTEEDNVYYLNVYNYGDINVVNVDMNSYDLYIAGITNQISTDKYMKNSLNDGNIMFADITGTGNIYVGGLANFNYAGDLDDAGQSETQPIATEGIINSINSGDISTTYTSSIYGVNGTNNTFVGGVATFNKGSIQDTANLGNISVYNSSTSGDFDAHTESWRAGIIYNYTSGVVLGGITSVVLSGNSRIYDSANNGNIIAKAYQYARAGGVLGVALYEESDSGGITSAMGLVDSIEDSILSNGLNFGDVSAITSDIGSYSSASYSYSSNKLYIGDPPSYDLSYPLYTEYSTSDRPSIYASAGGVIGYGLSIMQRMLNHGTISSTDVAGGIIGATFALGADGGTEYTIVHITTAVNYGDIKAIDNSNYSNIDGNDLTITEVSTYYMLDNNTFIYPTGYTPELPLSKRGFGGIFGRLQRGTDGVMTSDGGEFDFIVNANPNIDLIGRLDQVSNFSSSGRFFRFSGAIYYSAKLNDTTQTVFTGFYWSQGIITDIEYQGYVSYSSYYKHTYEITYTEQYFHQQGYGYTETEITGDSNVFEELRYSYRTSEPGSRYDIGDEYGSVAYEGTAEVPWITEDPNDPNLTDLDTEYMYDPDFEMRSNPDLNEYIYYMTNDLLASRFTTTRPNGMYVLSTTAGQSYGAVIPKNLDISKVRMINEDYTEFTSLLTDYTVVSPAIKTSLEMSIEDDYNNLKQTTFNDKAELIPNDSVFVEITENGGSSTIVSNPTVDYVNNTVTFSISMEAFSPTQTVADYRVTDGLVSTNALIAERAEDYFGHTPSQAELETYRALLYPERNNFISTAYPADLEVTLPAQSITQPTPISLGYFTVYSEAFVGADLYAHAEYYRDYEVIIIFTPKSDFLAGTTGIDTAEFNGGSAIDVPDTTDITALGNVGTLGSVTLNFVDNKGLFTSGYDFKDNFVIKYNDGTIIDPSYYSVTSSPVTVLSNIGYYSITFTFINTTRGGDYYFEYSYFPTSTVFTCEFDKLKSTSKEIIDFDYYGEADSIVINGQTITSYTNVGWYPVGMDTTTSNFTETLGTGDSYIDNDIYDIDFMTAGSLILSPFAKIISAQLISTTFSEGYKTYRMEYYVEAEDETTIIYTHYLIERTIDLTSVLKDGNDVPLNDVYASREPLLTEFTVDLGLDQNLDLYHLETGSFDGIEISVSATTNDGLTAYLPSEIVGLTYSTDDYLNIDMSYETEPGIYIFDFKFYREGSSSNFITYTTSLEITKKLGTDAYLTDIVFSEYATETTYPNIDIVDVDGELITTPYVPAIYFDGIDYDGSDEADWPYYRIDGKVSNVPLDSYVPFFLDYLPFGSSISRYAYDQSTGWYWTDEADANSSEAVLSQLAADYSVFPDTLQEPEEGEEVMIKYRVTAEDDLTQVYYYMTVTDVTYNLSIVFDIYYCTDATEGSCVLAENSVDFSSEVVIITVQNLDTGIPAVQVGGSDPAGFPTYNNVVGLYNQMTEFYYTFATDYSYKFGRNMAGFYNFNVKLPLDRYLNDLYTYEIEFGDYLLNDSSNYVSTLDGKYYYIEYATTNRTRRFNIYIRPIESPATGAPYGLFDFFKSWFEED